MDSSYEARLFRIELIADQLKRAEAQVAEGDVFSLRIALILMDNAAELLMMEQIEGLLSHNDIMRGLVVQMDEIVAARPDDVEATAARNRMINDTISEDRERNIRWEFGKRIAFLRERGKVDDVEERVLNHLHDYRNDFYHHARPRPEAVLIACDVYRELIRKMLKWRDEYPISMPITPEGTFEASYGYIELARAICELADGRDALATNLSQRYEALEKSIDAVGKMMFGAVIDLLPARELVIRVSQCADDPPPKDELLKMKLRYTGRSVSKFPERIAKIKSANSLLLAFDRFASVERDLEPLEEKIALVRKVIDEDIAMEVDRRRGK